jgi:hypothetical protein
MHHPSRNPGQTPVDFTFHRAEKSSDRFVSTSLQSPRSPLETPPGVAGCRVHWSSRHRKHLEYRAGDCIYTTGCFTWKGIQYIYRELFTQHLIQWQGVGGCPSMCGYDNQRAMPGDSGTRVIRRDVANIHGSPLSVTEQCSPEAEEEHL